MEKIATESSTTTITLEKDKLINDNIHMDLGFRKKGSTGRVVVSVTADDLEALEKTITEFRNQLTMQKLVMRKTTLK